MKTLEKSSIERILLNNGIKTTKNLKLISKPSRKIYRKASFFNRGLYIIRTSQGIMTNKEAYVRNLGGEVLIQILPHELGNKMAF